MRRAIAIAILLAVTPAWSGCGATESDGEDAQDRPTVVATTTQVADLAANVAGGRAHVRGLLAPNADPHDHDLSPRDAAALEDAALILRSGGDLDAWLLDAIGGSQAPVLSLAERVPVRREGDAHWWHDPRNALAAVEEIEAALSAADPEGSATYAANARRYARELRDLDAAMQACLGEIPSRQRKLVTTHDALGYFLDRYGLELIGSVIPSSSTLGQPSAGETRELVEAMRREQVRAIFPETSLAPALEQAIARETGARVGDALYADTLGPEGSAGDSYLGSLTANARAIAEGLTGNPAACDLPA